MLFGSELGKTAQLTRYILYKHRLLSSLAQNPHKKLDATDCADKHSSGMEETGYLWVLTGYPASSVIQEEIFSQNIRWEKIQTEDSQ